MINRNEWALRDKKTFERLRRLIAETARTPFNGIGKPEPLKRELSGYSLARSFEPHTERDKNFYESKCVTLDRQIDSLVYELYDLTPEEIAIVEGRA